MPAAFNYISLKGINAYSVKEISVKSLIPTALNYISVKDINACNIEEISVNGINAYSVKIN